MANNTENSKHKRAAANQGKAASGQATTATVLHPRNAHSGRYDLPLLISKSPELAAFVGPNKYGDLSVDFNNPLAVVALNKALLAHHYGVAFWHLPEAYLCPPIPGRMDYIHYLADLLAEDHASVSVPTGAAVRLIDVGVGASAIYPLLGQAVYGWSFVGSDIDPVSVANVKSIVAGNPHLHGSIEARLQAKVSQRLRGVVGAEERFAASLCNPPFHASAHEAAAGSKRKLSNLKGKPVAKAKLNFGGQGNELWCPGGEVAFVGQIITESTEFAEACMWFTSLVSKKDSLPALYQQLRAVGAVKVKTIDMAQGQKSSRILAWTFLNKAQRQQWWL